MATTLAEGSDNQLQHLGPVIGDDLPTASLLDTTQYDASLEQIITGQLEAEHHNEQPHASLRSPHSTSENLGESPETIGDLRRTLQHQISASLARRYARQFSCRSDVRLLRSQVKSAWERFHRYRAQYRESRRLYEREMDPIAIRYSGMSAIDDLDSLRRRFDGDRERLEEQCAEATAIEKQLEARELDLEAREAEYLDASKDLLLLIDSPSDISVLRQLQSTLSGRARSPQPVSPRLDPRLERYYDKAGDVKIMCERLLDLDEWRQEAVTTRELLADRGEPLPIADDELEKDYLQRRAIIETELNIVIAEADKLREECEQANLDVNAWQKTLPETEDDAAESSAFDEDEIMPEAVSMTVPAMTTASPSFRETGRRTEDIIESLLSGPAITESSSNKDAGPNSRVAHWVENLLLTSPVGAEEPTALARDARPALAEVDLAGSTAVPSLASWGQTASSKQILNSMADATRSKSDTIVTILKQREDLGSSTPGRADSSLANPGIEPH